VRFEEVEALRRRAREFLRLAEVSLREGAYDAAAFLAAVSLQLYLKSVLLGAVGDYPRTHSVRVLLSEIARRLGREDIEGFVRANRARLIALEDAYFTARYSTSPFTQEDAEDAVKLVREVIEVVDGGGERVRGDGGEGEDGEGVEEVRRGDRQGG